MPAGVKQRSPASRGRSGTRSYHHGALKEALLEVAESVLLDEGVEGFTLRECARRVGVSHGAPAHHFGDARGLLSEFTAVSFEQLAALMQQYRARATADGYAQLVATGLAYVDYAMAHRARFQLMFRSDRLDYGNARLQAAANAAYGHLEATMQLVISEAGMRQESIGPKITLAWSMVHGFATLLLDNRSFAEQAGGSAERAHNLMQLLLQMTRAVFEGPMLGSRAPRRSSDR